MLCKIAESAVVNLWNIFLNLFWREYVINIHVNIANREDIYLRFFWHIDAFILADTLMVWKLVCDKACVFSWLHSLITFE